MLQKIKGKAVKHIYVGFLLLSVDGSRGNEGSDSHMDTEMLVGNLELAVFTIETDNPSSNESVRIDGKTAG